MGSRWKVHQASADPDQVFDEIVLRVTPLKKVRDGFMRKFQGPTWWVSEFRRWIDAKDRGAPYTEAYRKNVLEFLDADAALIKSFREALDEYEAIIIKIRSALQG